MGKTIYKYLSDLEEKEGIKITINAEYVEVYDGNNHKIKASNIIDHKYLAYHFTLDSFSKALWDYLNYGYDIVIEEFENELSNIEKTYLEGEC